MCTYTIQQYFCETNTSFLQTFAFTVSAGTISVQLSGGDYSTDWITPLSSFLRSNGNSDISDGYLSVIVAGVSANIISYPNSVCSGRFSMGQCD